MRRWANSRSLMPTRPSATIRRCRLRFARAAIRLHTQTALIENGFVHIPETAPWLAEYLHELTVFPNGKHDDQADSTAQFLDWFKKPMPNWADL